MGNGKITCSIPFYSPPNIPPFPVTQFPSANSQMHHDSSQSLQSIEILKNQIDRQLSSPFRYRYREHPAYTCGKEIQQIASDDNYSNHVVKNDYLITARYVLENSLNPVVLILRSFPLSLL